MAIGRDTFDRFSGHVGRWTRATVMAAGQLRKRLPSKTVILLISILLWVLSGFFVVDTCDQGAVERFGKLDRIEEPGLHYHLPWPFERVLRCNVEEIKRFTIGLANSWQDSGNLDRTSTDNVLILTADDSLVCARLVVQTSVSSIVDYLYNVENPDKTVYDVAVAALNAILGSYGFDEIFAQETPVIETQVRAKIQSMLDEYQSGVQVVAAKLKRVTPPEQVSKAFAKLTVARERRRKLEIEASHYGKALIPIAKGDAAVIIQSAEAFKIEKIGRAKGDASRFLSQMDSYRQAETVTRQRLYLEAVEEIVSNASKVVVTPEDRMYWPPLPLGNLADPFQPVQTPEYVDK